MPANVYAAAQLHGIGRTNRVRDMGASETQFSWSPGALAR